MDERWICALKNFTFNLPLTWTELKYVYPFFRLKSPGFICRVLLFCSIMSLQSLPPAWRLGDIRNRQKHQFCWWRDRVRQNLSEKCNEAGSKRITYRLEFLKRLHKSLCLPPGISTRSQRQTELATKPACRP